MTADDIKRHALSLGFTLVGIAPIAANPETAFFPEWLARGYAGAMDYLARGKEPRMNPRLLAPEARSVVVCAVNYNTARTTTPPASADRLRAWISRYAWGLDYHDVLNSKLRALAHWMDAGAGSPNAPNASNSSSRSWVDTGPLLERVFARYAGIGWFGKNTCIIHQKTGSWLFLGCILTDLELQPDTPAPDRCGSCTRCLDACPTDAIVAPYVLDSRKCISYQTIELRGAIPEADRVGIGHHLFGCDICQDVCPWNRKAPVSSAPAFDAAFDPKDGLFWPHLETLLDLDETGWRALIRGTAMKRAKVKGLLRNLLTVAGNSGVRSLLPRLRRFLDHEDAAVREHAEWAMRKLDAVERESASAPPKTET